MAGLGEDMPSKKILDREPIPGGNPDRPTKRGDTKRCTTPRCTQKEFKHGLCSGCWEDFLEAKENEPDVDAINEAFDRARNS
jgi:hypothetical protein